MINQGHGDRLQLVPKPPDVVDMVALCAPTCSVKPMTYPEIIKFDVIVLVTLW